MSAVQVQAVHGEEKKACAASLLSFRVFWLCHTTRNKAGGGGRKAGSTIITRPVSFLTLAMPGTWVRLYEEKC